MSIMPLVLVTMIAAVVRMREMVALGKIGGMVIGILFGIRGAQGVAGRCGARRVNRRLHRDGAAIVMKLVRMIMAFTPYGILALMTDVVASSNVDDIVSLLTFVLASYVAIAIMFEVHALFLLLNGVDVSRYARQVWPVLTFVFTSRSSAATIPLNVETQVDNLKVPVPIANLAATFGALIGQNGCAGIYPAMLATMVAPTMGIDPLDPTFIAGLVAIIAISSFGVAGVGGGATFAALIVLPAMGMPIALVALLVSIEPLIDMGRTALNVNGSMTAGVLTGRLLNHIPGKEETGRAAADAASGRD